MVFADFGPIPGSEVGARNGRERVECGPERPLRLTGAVRRLPQEPPTTRGNRRDRARKNPNRERLGFCYWWRRRESNPRPRVIHPTVYMLSGMIGVVTGRSSANSGHQAPSVPSGKSGQLLERFLRNRPPRSFRNSRTHRRGSGWRLAVKPLGRSLRRSQLAFCGWFNEAKPHLGMHFELQYPCRSLVAPTRES